MHVQGNETLIQGGRGRLRIGTIWSYSGLYAEPSSSGNSNDLVLGASSGLTRIGFFGSGQSLTVSGNTNLQGLLSVSGDITAFGNALIGRNLGVVGTLNVTGGITSNASLSLPANGLTVGTNQLVVSGGNVGIGTANPQAKLEVTGTMKVLGNRSGWSATLSGSFSYFVDQVAPTDGFVLATIHKPTTDRSSTGYIEGWLGGSKITGAYLTADSNSAKGLQESSFLMPVRKGENWKIGGRHVGDWAPSADVQFTPLGQ